MRRSLRAALILLVTAGSFTTARAHATGMRARRIKTFQHESRDTADIANLTAFGGRVYFTAEDRLAKVKSGYELWTSDGTTTGTQVLKDIVPGPTGSLPSHLIAGRDKFFFSVRESSSPVVATLWVSDGTTDGTRVVPGAFGAVSRRPQTILDDRLFWASNADGGEQREPWVTDGATPMLLADIHPTAGSNPYDFTSTTGGIFFKARDAAGLGLWFSNGTSAPVKLMALRSSNASFVVARSGGAFFILATVRASADDAPDALFRTDGTPEGTLLLRDGFERLGDPVMHVLPNDRLLFRAGDFDDGAELWTSDGTIDGTHVLVDILPGPGYGFAGTEAGEFGGELYFAGSDGVHGSELWKSDGTAAGTTKVRDLGTGIGSPPRSFVVAGDRLVFAANGGLWESDGTPSGTRIFYDGVSVGTLGEQRMAAAGGLVFFTERDDELWVCEVKEDDGAPDDGDDAGPEPADEDAGTHAPPADAGALAAPPTGGDERDACGCRAVGAIGPDLLGRGPALLAAVALAGVVARRRRRRT